MGVIRFLLAFSVLMLHTAPDSVFPMVGGRVAVETFFMISGFYMALILNEKYTSFRLFFTNRLLLLFPSYLVVLLATVCWWGCVQWFAGAPAGTLAQWAKHGSELGRPSAAYLVLVQVALFGQDVVMFQALDPIHHSLQFVTNFWIAPIPAYTFLLVPQAWSIGLELLFYLVAPFLVRARIRWLMLLIAASFGLRAVLVYRFGLSFDPWTYRFFPTELAWFLLGSCAYRVYRRLERERITIDRRFAWVLVAVTVGLILTLLRLPIPGRIPLFYGFFVLALPFLFSLTKKSAIDRYIGQLSYPMYLSHWLMLSILATFRIEHNVLLTTLLTLAASVLLLRYIERPIDVYRQRRAAANRGVSTSDERASVPGALVVNSSPAVL
jgi:peptidoglycan/LPS O-acetylase OafA/YrhL